MALDKDEIVQIKDAFKGALTERDKERAEEIRKAREEEEKKKWDGKTERRSDPKVFGGRRKSPEPEKKKSRGLFAA